VPLDQKYNDLNLQKKVLDLELQLQKIKNEKKKYKEKFQSLFSNLPGMVYRANLDWTTQIISNSQQICGYSIKEFDSHEVNWMKLIHPDDRQRIFEEGDSLSKEKLSIVQEYRIITKDGGTRWVRDHKTSIFNNDKKFDGVEGIVFDITIEAQTKSALEESEQRYRLLLQNANDAIYIHAINPEGPGQFLEVNDKACHLLGYTRAELLKMKISDIAIPEQKKNMPSIIKELFKSGHSIFFTEDLTKDGRRVPVEVSANKFNFGSSPAVLAIVRDISEQIKNQNFLKDQVSFFQMLIDTIPSPIFYKDAQGIYIGCNKAFESYIGLKKTELKGKSVYDVAPKELADKYKKADDDLFASKGAQTYEAQVKYADGSVHDVVFNKAVYLTNKNDIGGMVGVMVDITDRKKADQEKNELEAKLFRSQKLEAIGTLAGGIAHDFNNILSAIFGYTELAIIENIEDPVLEQNLIQIRKAAERAKDLVKQILAVARQSDNIMSPISVSLITEEVLNLMRASLPRTIEIKKRIESHSFIMGDSTQIHQIIMNLFSNAAQAIKDQEGVIEINVSDIKLTTSIKNEFFDLYPGSYVKLTISDNGPGIPSDIIKSIFEPYFTTKNPGEGTGLGLAIVHGIVKTHGGEIAVESLLNKGTKFTVYFPISNKKNEKLSYENEILPTGNEHILFIDDEVAIADVNKQFLEKLGYSVYTYINSIEALEFFRTDPNKFDLVITDMTMPKMTGDVLAEKIKAIRSDIPIIICTGYSNKISDELVDQIGIDAVCNKPISIKNLAKTIRNVLR
jgi:PAS domain S-box-containing protein